MVKRPGLLTAVLVFAIIFGALGLMKSLMAAGALIVGEKMQTMIMQNQPKPPNNQMQDAMDQMQAEAMQLQNRYKWVNIGLAAVNFFLSTALLVGGILGLRSTPAGRTLLLVSFPISAVYEGFAAAVGIMIQNEAVALQKRFMTQMMQTPGPGGAPPPGMPGFMPTFFEAIQTLTVVFAIGWALAKVAAYVFGIVYLRRPAVRALFAPEPSIPATAPQGDVDLGDFGEWDEPQQP